jgi:hypothetical protein
MKGCLHNSISYMTLNVPQTLVAISFELAIIMGAAARAPEPGASQRVIFTFAVLLGGYTAHGFVQPFTQPIVRFDLDGMTTMTIGYLP